MEKKKILKILTAFYKAGKPLSAESEELAFIDDYRELSLILIQDYGYIRAYNSASDESSVQFYRITATGIEMMKQIKKELRPIGFTIK